MAQLRQAQLLERLLLFDLRAQLSQTRKHDQNSLTLAAPGGRRLSSFFARRTRSIVFLYETTAR